MTAEEAKIKSQEKAWETLNTKVKEAIFKTIGNGYSFVEIKQDDCKDIKSSDITKLNILNYNTSTYKGLRGEQTLKISW